MATNTQLDPQIVDIAKAIRQNESGGNASAKGASGEYGLYQFEPATWNSEAPKYGVSVPLEQATPEQQNEVAFKQLSEWKQKNPTWNVGNFASAWNAGMGEPDAYKGTFSTGKSSVGVNEKGVKYDVPTYAKNVATLYQKYKSERPQTVTTQTPTNQIPQQVQAPSSLKSFISGAGRFVKGTAGVLNNIGTGIGEVVDKTGLGLGKAAVEGVGAAEKALPGVGGKEIGASLDKVSQGIGEIENKVSQTAAPQTNTISGKIGQGAGEVAVLASPTDDIAAAKNITVAAGEKVGSVLEKLPSKVGKGLSYISKKVINAIPEAISGYVYGRSQGQKPTDAAGTAALFGVTSGVLEGAGDAIKAMKGSLAENVGKAIGMTGKMSSDAALKKVPQASRALSFIYKMSPDIKVLDADGVEKQFDPKSSTFGETLQALKQAKDHVYNAYSELAKKAGDSGMVFTSKDFDSLLSKLQSESENTTSTFKNKANSLINDLKENFGSKNEDGSVSFDNTALSKMQGFLEKVNTDVNPLSDKAGAQVSGTLSKELRSILDNKITGSTGEGYQALRSTYGDLRSIEDNLINQFKKTTRGQGGTIGKYVEAFGSLDFLVSALEKNPIGMAKDVGMAAIGKYMNLLKDPEAALQRSFSMIEDAPKSSATVRAFGK